MNSIKAFALATCAFMACGFAYPAMAGSKGDASWAEANRLTNSGRSAFDNAIGADEAGNYGQACTGYRNAAIYWENAIHATLGMLTDPDYDQTDIRATNDDLQAAADQAKASANEVCGKSDAPVYSDEPDPATATPPEAAPVELSEEDAAKEVRRQFHEVYLPLVAQWAPYIETPFADRPLQKLKVYDQGEYCRDRWDQVKKARIASVMSAVELCLAVKYWLHDNPASTCFYLHEDDVYRRDYPQDEADLAREYDAAGLPAIKARLRKAAACETRSAADWNTYSIAAFINLPSYAHALPTAAAAQYYYECAFAYSLAAEAKYDVAVSAITWNACGTTFSASDNEAYNSAEIACRDLGDSKTQLNTLLADRPDAAGSSEAPRIYNTIARLQTDLGCSSGNPQLRPGGPPVGFSRPRLPGEAL